MPLLMCPNDSGAMQTVERSGVQFDMCPQCRGVWLDRGELEKLMEASRNEAAAAAPPPQPAPQPYAAPPPGYGHAPPPQPWGRDGRGYDDRRYRDDDYRYKKKKHASIFDIFD